MKRTRKFAAFVASILAVACMAAPMATSFYAEAAGETYSIVINNSATGHTYDAYQIFSGDLSTENGSKILSNIKWGSGQTNNAVGSDATDKAATLTDSAAALAFAKTLTLNTTPTGTVNTSTDGKYTISGLEPGYYLVKDRDASLTGADDAYTAFIMEVVGNAEATVKSAKPTVDKQVYDNDDSVTTGDNNGWGETADHAINESFQFKLIATIPRDSDYAYYEKYKLVFTDTMSEGVTFDSIASVKIGSVDVPVYAEGTAEDGYVCTASQSQAGGSWTLTINDVLKYDADLTDADTTIEVVYNAHLNESAKVNKASGDTTNANTVGLQYSNNPNVTGAEAGNELGKTPDDTVWVFTYEVDNTKVDQDSNPLPGAGFKLYNGNGEVGLIYDNGLNAYRPVKTGENAEEMTSAETTGKFNIVGLDAGAYTLKETNVPTGYNKCADVEVIIGATHSENADGAGATVTLSDTSTMNVTITNQKGSSLPSTGGIGTTIFYVGGGALVVGAGVLLIAKKRMSNK